MVKKSIFKRVFIDILLLTIALIFIIILYKGNNKKNKNFNIIQLSTMKIYTNNNEIIEISDINTIVLYNTVMVPLEETLEALFGSTYHVNQNQIINYGSTQLNIDLKKNIIEVPQYYSNDDEIMNNTVKVEIEEYDNTKYIPIYLISNVEGLDVILDGKNVYKDNNYISSLDVIKNNDKMKHSIEIIKETNENKETVYVGKAKGSLWREEAFKRIEKYRKRDICIVAKNQKNNKIDSFSKMIDIKNNEFEFGTAVGDISGINNFNSINRSLFNTIGSENGLKWKGISILGYKRPEGIVSFADTNNMSVRGHVLWIDSINNSELNKIRGNEEEPEENTMAYVYQKYQNGEITEDIVDEKTEIIKNKLETLVLNHILDEVGRFPTINEWDVVNELINKQYFKYFLYDGNYIKDKRFLDYTSKSYTSYVDNLDYYKFIAKCFEKTRELSPNSKLTINENVIRGDEAYTRLEDEYRAINNIKKYTNNLNAIGIQFHIGNRYQYSPQSYYNNINNALQETGIKDAVITEYDNYTSEKLDNYTAEENKTRADYLRDALIMAYSNPNISEFCFWVYNSDHFCDEERQAYEEFVTPLLNYTESGTSDENGYSTRLYKGEYEATVKLKNGKEKTVNFTVSDDSSDTVEVVFEADLEKIDIKHLPVKTVYYQDNSLNLVNGKIIAYYDDDTTMEIDMTDPDVSVSGYNKDILGKQTITVDYQGKTVQFDIEVKEHINNTVNRIANSLNTTNQTIANNNQIVYSNQNVQAKCTELSNSINSLSINVDSIDQNVVTSLYNKQIELASIIFDEFKSENMKFENAEQATLKAISDILNTTNEYKELFSYYVTDDDIQISPTVTNTLNEVINKYNNNIYIDISNATDLIEKCKDLYQNSINTDDMVTNYINKLLIINTCKIVSNILDYDIELEQQKKAEQIKNNETYKVDNYIIRNISNKTTTTALLNKLGIGDAFKIYRNDNEIQNTSIIATGDILKVNNDSYTLIVVGDINRDGKVTASDLVGYRKHLLGISTLTSLEAYAADTNLDNQLKVGDLVGIRKIILDN